jgi:hypothetical protein
MELVFEMARKREQVKAATRVTVMATTKRLCKTWEKAGKTMQTVRTHCCHC